jgi:hypothetical protein
MSRLEVERVGGFAGFGLPGSRLRSRGEIDTQSLSPDELQAIDALFGAARQADSATPDAFRYRLTRHEASGSRTVEVAEDQVPFFLRDCIKDELV